ncbi:YtpI family protein [Paenibacillus sp. ISL-20]|uniref:YtpI family protein n=1 Tax=Paenibacillus sp. ISL-20 TaxID=2819163 RepID=UPI001BE84CF9|nr:YtpI family protein [Paenibacillus sp. ISL-20]MBT2762446.1 YtpI family protein [Paenibacillus sp. ISL-20]
MITVIHYILYIILVLSVIAAALYSIRARRVADPADRGIYMSMMNLYMGIMLVSLSLVCMFLFSGSTPAVIVEAVFLVLGAFNIFSGLRSRTYYSRQKDSRTAS